jgi:hypothetical protein
MWHKTKLLNASLIFSTFIIFLEWGNENKLSYFLIEIEKEVVYQLLFGTHNVLHPFILFPLSAQIGLVCTLFQKKTNLWISYYSIGLISILVSIIFIGGLLTFNMKIIFSTVPFYFLSFLQLKRFNTMKKSKK